MTERLDLNKTNSEIVEGVGESKLIDLEKESTDLSKNRVRSKRDIMNSINARLAELEKEGNQTKSRQRQQIPGYKLEVVTLKQIWKSEDTVGNKIKRTCLNILSRRFVIDKSKFHNTEYLNTYIKGDFKDTYKEKDKLSGYILILLATFIMMVFVPWGLFTVLSVLGTLQDYLFGYTVGQVVAKIVLLNIIWVSLLAYVIYRQSTIRKDKYIWTEIEATRVYQTKKNYYVNGERTDLKYVYFGNLRVPLLFRGDYYNIQEGTKCFVVCTGRIPVCAMTADFAGFKARREYYVKKNQGKYR